MFQKVLNPLERCLLKFASDVEGVFSGYAATFNTSDAVNDTMLPGVFKESLESGRRIKMFFNHNHKDIPIGDWVTLAEDNVGLFVEGKIDLNHIMGPTLYSAMKRNAVDGLSQGFTTKDGDYEKKAGGGRAFKNLNLIEISPVNFPCETQARISDVKSDVPGLESLSDFEHYLRDAGGFSKSEATYFVSQFVKCVRSDSAPIERQITGMEAKLANTILEFGKQIK
jgi:HK97 family phage prohead protease